MKEQSPAAKLLRGAAVLSLAVIVSKLIGTLQKIPLQNIGGDGAFGIYNTVYPFYNLIVTLATIGLPTAISKFVAERLAAEDDEGARDVLKVSSSFITVVGLVCGLGMYFGAPYISSVIDNRHTTLAIRTASAAFLFVPLMSALRGYFQGKQNMMPTAVSQVTEQCVRVAVMIALLLYLTRTSASSSAIAAGATFGSAAGGLGGLLVMIMYWRHDRHRTQRAQRALVHKKSEPYYRLLKQILIYAIPICAGSLAVPLINLVDTFTVPRLLKQSGWSEEGAMVQFGIYNRGIPLVQLVTMLAASLSVLFIPALAEASYKGQKLLIQKQTIQALRWFWLIGLAASAGLAILAEPINIMLYQDNAGTTTMRWIAFTAAGSTMVTISAALLQGMGYAKAPAIHLLGAAVLKTVLNMMLIPSMGISGAAIAGAVSYAVSALFNIILLKRVTGLRLRAANYAMKPAMIVGAMACSAAAVSIITSAVLEAGGMNGGRFAAALESLLGICIGAVVFFIMLILTKLITKEELALLPKIGPSLVKRLEAAKILR
ncbi:polysaccharide biosynthesis protein [Paenibacillus sediminis]|uniref:PST family polysaccharide transporter n=1 Tax=Paenibacillus sediminis TaxID=664909 RepID=A0ABS4H7F5_9BACL|nr:polysaccharide biosynthesis protein [Paenibacillus sediminis]MBP1938445.1 PST family polysaccharide transporter [Paenibacillus sediminis]